MDRLRRARWLGIVLLRSCMLVSMVIRIWIKERLGENLICGSVIAFKTNPLETWFDVKDSKGNGIPACIVHADLTPLVSN